MLQGVLAQLCFPQLSLVSREVSEALKIDFITALPVEIAQKILGYLDTVSLTKAAQVSQRWRQLADDDAVWVRMCEQHVNRKCTKCGWGLPLLERKRLRNYTRQRQLAKDNNSGGTVRELADPSSHADANGSPSPGKRPAESSEAGPDGKRRCLDRVSEQEPKTRSWKAVYRDRWQVGYNWKYGRCSVKTLKGHTNGVTCLQLDDHILATGSYDATIKICTCPPTQGTYMAALQILCTGKLTGIPKKITGNIETGEEIRTLRGHTRGIRALQFDETKLISGSLDSTFGTPSATCGVRCRR